MRDTVAERVLATVMDWDAAQVARFGSPLQQLAAHKYDSYEGYRPGVKFLENLTGWLYQFDSLEDRRTAIDFVLDRLIFISRAELEHLIETVYPDHIRPMLIERAARELGLSRFSVHQIISSQEFEHIQRRTLVLGLSDGAHIDQLRRTSPELSHEQIFLATDIGDEAILRAVTKLQDATGDQDARFEQVLLIDDFYGSGRTLLRESDGAFAGRLWRVHQRVQQLVDGLKGPSGPPLKALAPDAGVTILVYIASADAEAYVRKMLSRVGLNWELRVVQSLPGEVKVTDAEIERLCRWHYDPALTDRHKGDAPMGYSDCALPIVLQHNTPNNSISILWADSTDQPESRERRALFPRYERHRADRP